MTCCTPAQLCDISKNYEFINIQIWLSRGAGQSGTKELYLYNSLLTPSVWHWEMRCGNEPDCDRCTAGDITACIRDINHWMLYTHYSVWRRGWIFNNVLSGHRLAVWTTKGGILSASTQWCGTVTSVPGAVCAVVTLVLLACQGIKAFLPRGFWHSRPIGEGHMS